VPSLAVGHPDSASAGNPLGTKAVDRPGVIAPAPTVTNALEDVLTTTLRFQT
jgi:hypothetical protein